MTQLHYFCNPNCKKSHSHSYSTTSGEPTDEQVLDMVFNAAGKMYENNPGLIFKSFEPSGTFGKMYLNNAARLEIIRDIVAAHQLSAKTIAAINAQTVLRGWGSI